MYMYNIYVTLYITHHKIKVVLHVHVIQGKLFVLVCICPQINSYMYMYVGVPVHVQYELVV